MQEALSRQAGMLRLEEFLPRAGRIYTEQRNFDFGSDSTNKDRSKNVSRLSPFIQRRMICEDEVLKAVLSLHTPNSAEKFIQEVVWRTYWKSWLERRPALWTSYQDEIVKDLNGLSSEQNRLYQNAMTSQTGLECFDVWANELVKTGYLHNHTRMWFASIWIFYFGLPWTLGADFFYRHLLDADAASNTLSWRWVAGLHTIGKFYLASSQNIEKFTNGRFNPTEIDEVISKTDRPVRENLNFETTDWQMPPRLLSPTTKNAVLVVTPEELSLDQTSLSKIEWKKVFLLDDELLREHQLSLVRLKSKEAIDDCETRWNQLGHAVERIRIRKSNRHLSEIVPHYQPTSSYAPYWFCGPLRDHLGDPLQQKQERPQIILSSYDRALMPHGTSGFFAFKKQIPKLLAELSTFGPYFS